MPIQCGQPDLTVRLTLRGPGQMGRECLWRVRTFLGVYPQITGRQMTECPSAPPSRRRTVSQAKEARSLDTGAQKLSRLFCLVQLNLEGARVYFQIPTECAPICRQWRTHRRTGLQRTEWNRPLRTVGIGGGPSRRVRKFRGAPSTVQCKSVCVPFIPQS